MVDGTQSVSAKTKQQQDVPSFLLKCYWHTSKTYHFNSTFRELALAIKVFQIPIFNLVYPRNTGVSILNKECDNEYHGE